jgi:hypothetical protein
VDSKYISSLSCWFFWEVYGKVVKAWFIQVLCGEVEYDLFLQGYVTYTPRLLLVDLKGSLRHLRQEGDLYNHTEDVKPSEGHWPVEKVDVVYTPKGEKNEFLNDLGNEENAMDSTEARGKCGLKSLSLSSLLFITHYNQNEITITQCFYVYNTLQLHVLM